MTEHKHDYAADVKKYVSNVDTAAVDGIVRHLGIVLHTRDASLVAATDPEELKRVREGFMKKKLALTESDAELDTALNEVMTRMKPVVLQSPPSRSGFGMGIEEYIRVSTL